MAPETSAPPETVHLSDTLTGQKVELQTLEPGAVGIYCCGPTVYDMSHIGHARAALVPDVVVRTLRWLGYRVKYVRNITDIDDKIIARANQEGLPPATLAAKYTAEYHKDLQALGMLEPDVEPRVSEHMPDILDLVQNLVERDMAYAVAGDVYYRVARFGPYGRLSKRNQEEMIEGAGSRVEVDKRKESPLDFALWKAAKPGEPFWQSPWGPGRPGWHIECSAMSCAHLGERFDIHGGGRDLIFPHHENEIAQSQGAHGTDTFARYWLHNGFINFAGEKMSKSLGNVFTIREILERYDAEATRAFLLTVHYRTGLNFDVAVRCPDCGTEMNRYQQEAGTCAACQASLDSDRLRLAARFPGLEEAEDRVAYIYGTLEAATDFLGDGAEPQDSDPVTDAVAGMLAAFREAMRNDFNTPAALGELSKPLNEVNGLLASGKGVDKRLRRATIARFVRDVAEVGSVLGLYRQDPRIWRLRRRDLKAARLDLDTRRVDELLVARDRARQDKNWDEADRLRDQLRDLGVSVQDGPQGSVWNL